MDDWSTVVVVYLLFDSLVMNDIQLLLWFVQDLSFTDIEPSNRDLMHTSLQTGVNQAINNLSLVSTPSTLVIQVNNKIHAFLSIILTSSVSFLVCLSAFFFPLSRLP